MVEGAHGGIGAGASRLLDAVQLISAGLDLRGSLHRLVEASCALTDARYGVIGLLDADGVVNDFVIHGVDAETAGRIASLPTCEGVLGVLVEDPKPLRLVDVGDHARSMGFPPNHPPMSSFLGVPVLVDDKVYGNLYLTEKAGGAQFTAEDESLLQVLAEIAGSVIANARTHQASERRQRWLEAGVAMSEELQNTAELPDALQAVARHLRQVSGSATVAVVADLEGTHGVVALDDGSVHPLLADLDKVLEVATPVLIEAEANGRTLALPRIENTDGFVVPLNSKLVPGHVLLVLTDGVDPVAGELAPVLLTAFADQAALALDRTAALAERQELLLIADRDRIARDLHDSVIQRLFATALQLQGLRRIVVLDEVRSRLDDAVAELNTTIRDIRSTIFELRHDDGSSLKSDVRALAKEYVPVLGFTPFVRIRGPLDSGVSSEVADHLMATLREALSNVARHAEADACIVEVEVGQERLLLRISDNGRGIDGQISESGLRNVRRRAVEHGGTFRIGSEEPHGTLLEWQIPVR
ncbi:GAF domain-containing sensor histidine kinase [Nocardioides marmorisolisilvae]|uniref:GAF domain-containing protein n=1 Tax=Nocardioides marmorisolisilvae TaxID=1542737 RepID=A0A3N0DNT3_9ACTN|nr:GAF domain-containing sensor histidine kinase [Nocardioides marmorisolisilvae]RNL77304.1 GAF domain-containing protein [Nocardioides marmorisolisilvae]